MAVTDTGEVLGLGGGQSCLVPGRVPRGHRALRLRAPDAQSRGIGTALLAALTGSADPAGMWTIQAGVFPENTTSLRLHRRAGDCVAGTRERIGCHHGLWRDVTFLERRSSVAGT